MCQKNNHFYVRYSNGIHVLCLLIYVNARCKNVRWRINKCIQGISNKLLPGSFPAVDVAASFGFGSPNAVLFGFVSGLIGQVIMIVLLIVFKTQYLLLRGLYLYSSITQLLLYTQINVVVGEQQ